MSLRRIICPISQYRENDLCTRVTNRFRAHERAISLFISRCEATRVINTKISLEVTNWRPDGQSALATHAWGHWPTSVIQPQVGTLQITSWLFNPLINNNGQPVPLESDLMTLKLS